MRGISQFDCIGARAFESLRTNASYSFLNGIYCQCLVCIFVIYPQTESNQSPNELRRAVNPVYESLFDMRGKM